MSEKGKDSIVKLLLSGETANTIASSPRSEMGEESNCKLSTSLHQLAGYPISVTCTDKDHSYSRPSNWRPENLYAKPKKTLFVTTPDPSTSSPDDEIVVDEEVEPHCPTYDVNKAKSLMDECERHVNIFKSDEGDPDWEDHISRSGWTKIQNKIFNKVTRVLNNGYLARLAHKDSWNEPVLRRITIDKTAQQLRQILGTVSWDDQYTRWLHSIMLDNLDSTYLVVYLEALQTLKSKIPNLVERMMSTNAIQRPINAPPMHEIISIVHKRPWDPMSLMNPQFKTKRLPNDPILVMVPSGPGSGFSFNSRSYRWMAKLSTISTVHCVHVFGGNPGQRLNISTYMDQMFVATRAKLSQVRTDYGKKPIILVGIDSGAALACQVALVENVAAVVCLGFHLNTVEGNRGQPDDVLLNIRVPVLFVIGQNSSTTTVDEIEELREKFKVANWLVVVGAADDQLRISKGKKKSDGITQSMVNKCILDEIGDFLGNLLTALYRPPVRQPNFHQSSSHSEVVVRKPVIKVKQKLKHSGSQADESNVIRPKKGRKAKVLITKKPARKRNRNRNQQPVTTSATITCETRARNSMSQLSQSSSTPVSVNIGNLATMPGGGLRTTRDKHPLLKKRAAPKSSTITVVASSPSVISPVTTNAEEDGIKSTPNLDSNLVEELTPDKILELPVTLEDEQIENTETPVKVTETKASNSCYQICKEISTTTEIHRCL